MLNYETSYNNAVDHIRHISDIETAALRQGGDFIPVTDGGRITFSYFGTLAAVSLPDCGFGPDTLDQGEQILILHYFGSDGVTDPTAPEVTFQSLPGGMFYYPTFRKRGPDRVLKEFGSEPATLVSTGEKLNWLPGTLGDASLVVPVLPCITATVVIHAGDDEFTPEAQFLFRKDITSLIPLEDVAVIGTILATRLTIAKYQ